MVFASLHDDLVVRGFKGSLDVLLDEHIDELVATSVVVNLDGVELVAKMIANPLSGVIIMDIKDLNVAPSYTFGRLLANPTHKSQTNGGLILYKKIFFGKAVKFSVVHSSSLMSLLKEVTLCNLALKMAHTSRGSKCKVKVVIDKFSGLSFGLDMAIITLSMLSMDLALEGDAKSATRGKKSTCTIFILL